MTGQAVASPSAGLLQRGEGVECHPARDLHLSSRAVDCLGTPSPERGNRRGAPG